MSSLKVVSESGPSAERWRSLDELAGDPGFRNFVENEFPAYADEMLEPATRRGFLKFMGASLALAGLTACRWPREEVLPFSHRPEGYTPGVPQHYATAMELGGVATGLLVAAFDGRPIKIEGNPLHPSSLGASSAIMQAALLEMYDPERSRGPARFQNGEAIPETWPGFEGFLRPQIAKHTERKGAGLVFLAEASSSPSLAALRGQLAATHPLARWFEWEPNSRDAERAGTQLATGRPLRSHVALDRAEVIVAIDEDPLYSHPAAVRLARDFADGRDPVKGQISRLWVVESCMSLTGTIADERILLAPALIPVAVGCLAARLVHEHGLVLPATCEPLGGAIDRFRQHSLYAKFDRMAAQLAAARGRSAILVGPRQPSQIHALVVVLNEALGNVGATVRYTTETDSDRPSHVEALRDAARLMGTGRVDTLIVLGGNPVFDAPADLDFAAALARVPMSLHLSYYRNETSRAAKWHLPRAHFLESWDDARDWEGRHSLVQPLIEPLFTGRTPSELLAMVLNDPLTRGYDIVRRTFAASFGEGEPAWRRALHDGLIADASPAWADAAPIDADWASALATMATTTVDETAIQAVFLPDAKIYDGRYANNGWLQELPDPLTKLTWDNAALVAPATAQRLGIVQGDLLRLECEGRSIEIPAYVMPGQSPGAIGLPMGYGRRAAGSVGDGVGFDVYALRGSSALHVAPVQVTRGSGSHRLATTQEHYAIDPLGAQAIAERVPDLARETTAAAYFKGVAAASTHADAHGQTGEGSGHAAHATDHGGDHDAALWADWEYPGHRWAMAIDLNRCNGCSACVIACQAENNIPVVGKDEVDRGREMHWIRVDRYFAGGADEPDVVHQPVACHHCEKAPCETVCPVAATVHDTEGLNVMVYNRCVGTRYCMNNCPYKVRRFNYFNNHKNESALEMMIYNPEVTVRSRGVMEKCSFCIQRIQRARNGSKLEGRELADGEITTACQQACPTRAITFGDLNDPKSRVRALHDDRRSYAMLDFLGIKPRTRYLERLRNRDGDAATEA